MDALLGEGGFKSVWRAHDSVLGRDVALAVYRLDHTQSDARTELLREARALARLGENPRIVTVYDVGEFDGVPYLVTRLMTGGDPLALEPAAQSTASDSSSGRHRQTNRSTAPQCGGNVPVQGLLVG
jgi:serine/threonine protein kinase